MLQTSRLSVAIKRLKLNNSSVAPTLQVSKTHVNTTNQRKMSTYQVWKLSSGLMFIESAT